MSIPAEDERWTRILQEDQGRKEVTDSGAVAAAVPDGQLAAVVADLTKQVAQLAEEVKRASQITDQRFEEVRRVIAAAGEDTAAVASAAGRLSGLASSLSERLSNVEAQTKLASEAAQQARTDAVGRVLEIEQTNTDAIHRFRDSFSRLSSELGDALLQVSARLGAADDLGRSINAVTAAIDKPQLDRMAQQLDWLVTAVQHAMERPRG